MKLVILVFVSFHAPLERAADLDWVYSFAASYIVFSAVYLLCGERN